MFARGYLTRSPTGAKGNQSMIMGNAHLAALGLGILVYAVYCRRQAGRHRIPGADRNELVFAGAELTPRGRVYRRRYYWALALGLVVLLVAGMVPPF